MADRWALIAGTEEKKPKKKAGQEEEVCGRAKMCPKPAPSVDTTTDAATIFAIVARESCQTRYKSSASRCPDLKSMVKSSGVSLFERESFPTAAFPSLRRFVSVAGKSVSVLSIWGGKRSVKVIFLFDFKVDQRL